MRLLIMHWNTLLPAEYQQRVLAPSRFEWHEDASVKASKVIGLDKMSRRCFYFHEFTLAEECFDEEGAIFEIAVYHEMAVAWKTKDGSWIRLKAYAMHPQDCTSRVSILPIEIVDEKDLGR